MKTTRLAIVTALAVLTGLAYADDPPTEGTFWSAAKTNEPAYPFNFAPELPAIAFGSNTWLIDDTTVDYSSPAYQSGIPDPPTGDEPPGEYIPVTNSPPVMIYGVDDFWIEILGVTNDLASLALHNVRSNWYGQILSRTNIEDAAWRLGPFLQNADGTNFLAFEPLPTFGLPRTFYRGVQGFPVVWVERDRLSPSEAIEPDDTNSTGQVSAFAIRLSDQLTTNLTVHYQLSGTAINGMDYANLSGTVTIGSNSVFQQVFVQPLYDGLLEFDEPVTLTLILTNGYIVDPDQAKLTIFIKDAQATNVFGSVVTNLDSPAGIDYSPPLDSLLISHHYFANTFFGPTNNFARIFLAGANVVVTNWSAIAGLQEEVKLVTVKTNANGFTNGDMHFSSGAAIGRLSADGTVSNMNWCVPTNAAVTNALELRGGFHLDQSGSFSNELIAVVGDNGYQVTDRGVWRVNAQGTPTLLANILTPHLEGAITLTNDPAKWGPWAGKIITGDEFLGIIYAIDPIGSVSSFDLGIQPEDFDLIPPNQDLYCLNSFGDDNSALLKIPHTLLTNHVGNLLITQAGESGFLRTERLALFVVSWDSTNHVFNTRRISLPDSIPGTMEHVTFAPLDLPVIPQ